VAIDTMGKGMTTAAAHIDFLAECRHHIARG
jgi:hypothetical protein